MKKGNKWLCPRRLKQLAVCTLALLLCTLPGCGGCRWFGGPIQGKDSKLSEEEKKQRAEEQQEKPDFEPIKVTSLPDDSQAALKPGHWTSVRCELKANNFDFVGDLQLWCVGRKAMPLELVGTRYRLRNSRPVSLVKGQTRTASLPLFVVPDTPAEEPTALRVNPVLAGRHLARAFDFGAYPVTRLLSHQYYLAVLAANPDRYGFLKVTTVARPPVQDYDQIGNTRVNYLVTMPQAEEDLELPDSALFWTSTAFVIWDGLEPDSLSAAQQTALLDWIHWGGRLIVAGPKSLEKLRLGFLQPFLPVGSGQITAVSAAQVDELNEFWSIEPRERKPERSYEIQVDAKSSLQVMNLQLLPPARFIPHSGNLVAERRVGRGRILVTAFQLDDRRMINWPGFDSFLNSCLLGRPARRFASGRDNLGTFEWKDLVANTWDPRYSSQLRYFSRDAYAENWRSDRGNSDTASEPQSATLHATGEVLGQMGFRNTEAGGMAAWNDFSSVAVAAREALVNAAGISVPDGNFVLKLLAVYLVCLVPINWMVFRLLNRVELAWTTAPLIAILGALAVIKLAQLDIGFVRSRTEIAVVETQPGYPRAHVTRFAGLYSSLSSRYDLEFDGVDGVALPFSANPSSEELRLAAPELVEFRQRKQNELKGLPIFSNSTGMVHSEQMTELAGTVRLVNYESKHQRQLQVQNDSDFDLHSTLILHRQQGRFRIVPVGLLERGAMASVVLRDITDDELDDFLDDQHVTQPTGEKGNLSLRGLIELALDARQLQDGAIRLVAWSEQDLEGLTIRPRASQRSTHIVWVHQLRYGEGPDPEPDENLFEDFRGNLGDIFEEPEMGFRELPD